MNNSGEKSNIERLKQWRKVTLTPVQCSMFNVQCSMLDLERCQHHHHNNSVAPEGSVCKNIGFGKYEYDAFPKESQGGVKSGDLC